MKVFVTGGAGFIGSHIVDRLVAEGNEVTVYDNLSTGKKEFLNRKARFVQEDLLDLDTLTKVMKGHTLVFHLAANVDVRFGASNPELDLKQNTLATYNVLEAMRLNDIKKIAFSSTCTVYGEARKIPTPERYAPLLPISMYGANKLAAEGLVCAFCEAFGMRSWIFRFANIIGPRGTHGVIFDFIQKLRKNPRELEILGDGKQAKSYLLVDECVDAMFFVMKKADEKVNLYNLGTGDQLSVTEIAKIVCEKLGLENVAFRYTGGDRGWVGDVPKMLLDVAKLNKLGWKAAHDSRQSVKIAAEALVKEKW